MRGDVRFAIGVILVHAALSFLHGAAHRQLHIGLSQPERFFVGFVIGAAPLASAYLLWQDVLRPGAVLLFLSMLGSFGFGLFKHFVAAGADNVSSVAGSGWGMIFRSTAVLLGVIELLGLWVGFKLLRAERAAP